MASSAVAVFGLPASAADLPAQVYTKAPVMVPLYNWTGFYLGANIGGSWGKQNTGLSSATTGATVVPGSVSPDGVIGGGQIGYNWQADHWVFGIEADFQGSGQRDPGAFTSAAAVTCGTNCFLAPGDNLPYTDKLDWFGTVRGRVGWAADRWLPYLTGGLAYGHGSISGSGTIGAAPVSFSASQDYVGWTIGAGLEWAFADHWSAKVEYLYIDFGNGPTAAVTPGFNVTTGRMTDNIGRFGVNYKF
jgi:outer membrane immunogenic protein